jgi:hypothetical protein
MPAKHWCALTLVLACVTLSSTADADDAHLKRNISGGPGLLLAQSNAMASMGQDVASHFQNGFPAMPNMQAAAGVGTVPPPQALGPKAPGKIRIGIAPAQAQLGQGNNGQGDFSTSIRNAIVYTMNGPAVEITPLDAHIPIQLQAEAQQKQCDYIMLSSVTVKHSSSSFDKYMKMGSAAANFNPMIAMTRSMGTMAAQASQVATQAAVMTAQQQVASQLASFNGQIKTKDDVTVDYQLYPTGQGQPKLQSSLKGKAKSDGEDVLTPLIEQAATNVLTEVTKK